MMWCSRTVDTQNPRKPVSCSQGAKRKQIMKTTITVEAGGMFVKEPRYVIIATKILQHELISIVTLEGVSCFDIPLSEEPNLGTWNIDAWLKVCHNDQFIETLHH